MEKKLSIKPEKIAYLEKMSDIFKNNSYVIFCNFSMLPVKKFEELRTTVKEKNGNIKVIKTNITCIAAKKTLSFELPDEMFKQNTFIVYGTDEVSGIVKDLKLLQKSKTVSIKGAIFDGSFLPASAAEKLSDMPTRQELYGMLANICASPYTRFARVLNEVIAQLPRALNAVSKNK